LRVEPSTTWPGSAEDWFLVVGLSPQAANKTNSGTARAKKRIEISLSA
jgi:hypothetical protein